MTRFKPCPGCGATMTMPDAPEVGSGRRIVKFIECECSTTTRLSTYEGWDRWYIIDSASVGVSGVGGDTDPHWTGHREAVEFRDRAGL